MSLPYQLFFLDSNEIKCTVVKMLLEMWREKVVGSQPECRFLKNCQLKLDQGL